MMVIEREQRRVVRDRIRRCVSGEDGFHGDAQTVRKESRKGLRPNGMRMPCQKQKAKRRAVELGMCDSRND